MNGSILLQYMTNHYTKHGLTKTIFYKTYYHILHRCNNKRSKDYHHYGGRGIKCLWPDFVSFYNDMSKTYQKGLEIERIDNNGHYCKENCRWATRKDQTRNRRNTKYTIDSNGKKISVAELAEKYNIRYDVLKCRLKRNLPFNKLILPCKDINPFRHEIVLAAKKIGISPEAMRMRVKKFGKEIAFKMKPAKFKGAFQTEVFFKINGKKYSYKQIEKITDIKANTIWARIHRQKKTLKECLKEKYALL